MISRSPAFFQRARHAGTACFARFRWRHGVREARGSELLNSARLGLAKGPCSRRRIRMLLSAGKAIARWEHDDIFGPDQHRRLPSDLAALGARALKRDADRGISRHIILLFSEVKCTARCELDIF